MSADRVLIVEDDPKLASLLRRALSLKGAEATVAEDGLFGRELWTEGRFDLVLLDVMLPGIDGISLCAEQRAAGAQTPVMLLTARDEEDTQNRGMAAGASDYITKSFSFADLISRVKLLLPGLEAR